jgi:hypothetical protein
MQKTKPNKVKEEVTATAAELQEVRDSLIYLVEMVQRLPSIRKDPVTQALVHKLCEQVVKEFGADQSFKTVGVAMNALRSAGVFETPTPVLNADTKGAGPKPKSKARSTEVDTPQAATEKGQKMRGLDRSIDFLEVFGYLTKDDIVTLRNLRSDPSRLVEFTKDNKTFQRRVKDTGDWDLLFVLDQETYDAWMALATTAQSDLRAATGNFAPERFSNLMEAATGFNANGGWTSTDHQELRTVLKGPPLEAAIKHMKKNHTDLSLVVAVKDQLLQQRWFKFGKSPTLS